MIAAAPTAAGAAEPDVLVLSTGDVRVPWYRLARPARSPAPRRADQPYRAAPGDPELRARIGAYCAGAGQTAVPAERVVVTPGARQAIFAVLLAVLRERREVLVPAPYWPSYPRLIELAGGVPVVVPAQVRDGALDLLALEHRRTPATAVVVVNSPRNPDGAVLSAESLSRLVEWTGRHRLTLLFDQVYRGVPVSAVPAPTVADLHCDLPGHCVVVDGLAKSHALAGLRLGWAVVPPALAGPVTAITSHLIGHTCGLAQDIATGVLSRDHPDRRRLGRILAANLALASADLAGLPGVRCASPEGGIFLFPDVSRWLAGTAPAAARREPAGWLRDTHRVAVVDGAAFGAPGHLRLSFAVPAEQLREGVRRLCRAIG